MVLKSSSRNAASWIVYLNRSIYRIWTYLQRNSYLLKYKCNQYSVAGKENMSKKKNLIEKLYRKPYPKNFTTRELDALMSRCNCTKFQGGRGSGIGYVHDPSKRIVQFDGPHPGNELYKYQVEKIKNYIHYKLSVFQRHI